MSLFETQRAAAAKMATGLGAAANRADRVAVLFATSIEHVLMRTAGEACVKAVEALPQLSKSAADVVTRFGKEAEARHADSTSVWLQSVPPAAYRTAAVVDWIGTTVHDAAHRSVTAVMGPVQPASDAEREHLRQVGQHVAAMVRYGLDAVCVGLSVRDHQGEINRLRAQAERRRR